MQRCPGGVHFHRMGDGHCRNSYHPRRQWRPIQGSAGEPRQFPNDNGVGRTGRCATAATHHYQLQLNGKYDENSSDRKDRQTAETL